MGARQVRRREVGPRPEHLGSVAHRHVRKVATLKPGEMIVKRRPDRLEADGGTRRSRDRVGPRNDDRGRTVDWNVAVVNAKRRRNHARIEIFVERSEEHTSELQSLMRISYAVFCLKKKK